MISAKAKGRVISAETKAKILQTKLKNGTLPKGERHYKWKGGKTRASKTRLTSLGATPCWRVMLMSANTAGGSARSTSVVWPHTTLSLTLSTLSCASQSRTG